MTAFTRGGNMKRAVVVFVLLFVLIGGAAADAPVEGMFNWYDPCGYTCYQWADGSGDCYPCLECDIETPTPVPSKEPTPVPPTETPIPPTEKPKCNRGLGNGPEGCDPGNSGGKPGSAGEGNE